jgi:hypothetical protein
MIESRTTISNRFYSIAAEGGTLGSMIVDNAVIDLVSERLIAEDFYRAEHKIIFDAIRESWKVNKTFDLIVLRDWLVSKGQLESIGGIEYLQEVANSVPSSASWDYYADSVREHSILRNKYLAKTAYLKALESSGTIKERLANAEAVEEALPYYGVNGHSKLVTQLICEVEPKQIKWLWDNRIPLGMISLVVGLPGQGKSFVSLDIAARLSRGTRWPDGSPCPMGETLIFAFEEDVSIATRPRLDAMGADTTKIHVFNCIDAHGVMSDLIDVHYHLTILEKFCKDHPDIKLVVFDPVNSALGQTDQNNQTEVREVMTLLAKFAERTGISIIGISHFAKRSDTSALYKTVGSISFGAVARSVWCVHRDPPNEQNPYPPRLFLPVKANYSIEVQGMSFDIVNNAVEWSSDSINTTADDAVRANQKKQQGNNSRHEAIEFIKKSLSDGIEHWCEEIYEAAEEMGISRQRISNASRDIGVKKRRCPIDKKSFWSIRTKEVNTDEAL